VTADPQPIREEVRADSGPGILTGTDLLLQRQGKLLAEEMGGKKPPGVGIFAHRGELARMHALVGIAHMQIENFEIAMVAPPSIPELEEPTVIRDDHRKKKLWMAGTAALAGLAAFGAVAFGISWRENRARRINPMGEAHGRCVQSTGT